MSINERKLSGPKVLMIGLDGCTFDLLLPWIESGQLPILTDIIKNGSYGTMKSTIPSLTAPAWTSLVTGVNPGKHGIFDFTTSTGRVFNARDVKAPKLWSILSHYGLRSCVINVPLTYPPESIDGVIVSGFLTPHGRTDYVSPPVVMDLLRKHGYMIDAPIILDVPSYDEKKLLAKRPALLKQEYETAEKRFETALDLMESNLWDFFFIIFKETDDLQHFFWDRRDILLEFYKKLDEYIGALRDTFVQNWKEDDVYVIVVSDHGFGPGKYIPFNLSKWIVQNFGHSLRITRLQRILNELAELFLGRSIMGYTVAHQVIRAYNFVYSTRVGHRLLDHKKSGKPPIRIEPFGLFIDHALFSSRDEYESFRSLLITSLPNIQLRSKKIFDKVWRREEIYKGPYIDGFPDLVFTTSQEFLVVGDHRFSGAAWLQSIGSLPGAHLNCPNAIIIISGNDVKTGRLEASIYDVVPTVLNIFGIPTGSEFDGTPLLERPVTRAYLGMSPEQHENLPEAFTAEENAQIVEKLRRLGYT